MYCCSKTLYLTPQDSGVCMYCCFKTLYLTPQDSGVCMYCCSKTLYLTPQDSGVCMYCCSKTLCLTPQDSDLCMCSCFKILYLTHRIVVYVDTFLPLPRPLGGEGGKMSQGGLLLALDLLAHSFTFSILVCTYLHIYIIDLEQ